MKTVHQIWIGSPLPEQEAEWVNGVRAAAQGAGWTHRLWTWEDLEATYGQEPVAELFRRLIADFPMPTTYTLMADYYRLRVLADKGGVYLDADFMASTWPEFPENADVSLLMEFFARGRACNGYFYCRKAEAMQIAAALAEKHLMEQLPVDALNLPALYVELVRRDGGRGGLTRNGVGPGFVRGVILPAWRARGMRFGFAPRDIVGHRQWSTRSALTHYGTARWHEGSCRADDDFWQQIATKADRMSATYEAKIRSQKMKDIPEHLRPCGGCIPPQRTQYISVATTSCTTQASTIPPQLRIPSDVRRVVVVSNVTTDFSLDMLPLRAGDLVLHCNHARHRAAAMKVSGTRHWLLVRHGRSKGARGWHWFHEGTFDGFEKVFFVDNATMMSPFQWWRDFRAICKKSPTTGFIAANVIREIAPHLPLILAGFDPKENHGTPQWDGHAWEVEAEWYARRRFALYRPRKTPRILLLVTSCIHSIGHSIRSKNEQEALALRQACRATWLHRHIPSNVEVRIIVGRGALQQEKFLRQLDTPDGFRLLPAKMRAAFRDALDTADFDWLVKCDDDSYLHMERLVQYVAKLPIGSRDVYGAVPDNGRLDCVCGGGGYILHRDTVTAIVNDARFPAAGREDVEVCRSVVRHGGKVIQEPRFNAAAKPSPSIANNLISCHHLTVAEMEKIHADCWPE